MQLLNYLTRGSLSFVFTLAFTGLVNSQEVLQVSNQITPTELVQEILIGGGIETSNITYTGVDIARGEFWGGPGNIGVESGVILTSGSINIAPGPNNSGSAGNNNGAPGDPDLQAISGVSSHNACVLEFDFVPQSSMVSFRYVFASEEYHEYANSSVNDAFGFFISGPGISGPFSNNSKNIALIPLSNTPVSINTVNNGTSNQGPCENCQYLVHNNQGFVQYDAFTTVLTAWANVIPCETYHIKLAIGDGGDGVYDSGVFLEAGSFSAVGISNEVEFTEELHPFTIEDCNTATITFRLSDQADEDTWIPLTIGGSAINGVDYLEIQDSVFFPVGYSTAEVEIIPFEDNQTEWTETVQIIYNSSLCSINLDTITIQIKDYRSMFVDTSPDTTINCNTSATISVQDLGGFEPYEIIWSTGDTASSLTVSPLITTTYYVTVNALCDSSATDSVTVFVNGPEANAGADQSVAYGTPATLNGSASAGSGSYTYLWEPASLLDDPTLPNPTTVLMESTTLFTLTVTDQAGGCQDADEALVTVTGGPLNVGPVASPSAICYGETSQLNAYAGGGSENYTYSWTSDPAGFISDLPEPVVNPMVTTTYFVTVSDGFSTVNGQVTVEVLPLPVPDAGSDNTIPHGTTTMLSGSASGGSGSYSYAWMPASKLVNPYAPNPTTLKLYETTLFRLTVTDENTGCVSAEEDLVTVHISGGPLTVFAEANDTVVCDGSGTQLHALGSGGDFPNYNYVWSSIPPGFSSTEPEPYVDPLQSTYYIVEIDDGFNKDYDTIRVVVSSLPPLDLGPDRSVCPYDSVQLQAGLSGLNYYWSNGSTEPYIIVGTTGIGFDIKTVWLEVTDALGCRSVDSVSVIFDFAACLGVEEMEDNIAVQLFPNPTSGDLHLSAEGLAGNITTIVSTLQGVEIYRSTDKVKTGAFEKDLSLHGHPAGMYFLMIIHDGKIVTGKILLK